MPIYEDKGAFNAYGGMATNNVAYPATIAEGNLLVIVVLAFGNRTATTPSGWTQIASISDVRSVFMFYKIADGTETGSETVTISSSVNSTSIMMRFSGNLTSGTPIESIINGGHVSSNSQFTGELTTTGADRLAAAVHIISANYVPSTPANYDLEFNELQSSYSTCINLFTQPKASAGTVASEESTTVSTSDRFMVSFAILPADTGSDNVSISSIETGAPEIGTINISQNQNVSVSNIVNQNPEISNVVVSQNQGITINDLLNDSPVIDNVSVSQNQDVLIGNLTNDVPVIGNVLVSQNQDVSIGDITLYNAEIDKVNVNQNIQVVIPGIEIAQPAIDNIIVYSGESLTIPNIIVGVPEIGIISVSQNQFIKIPDIFSLSPVIGAIIIDKTQIAESFRISSQITSKLSFKSAIDLTKKIN